MAAAIIPLVAAAVGAIGPQIPAIVAAVEGLFGHSGDTGKQEGDAKMQAAVQMASAALATFANAGRMPSAPVVDPSLPAGLAGAIQQAVDAMKATGQLGPVAAAQAKAPGPTTAVPVGGGRPVTIVGTLY